jgi:RNA-directed DNA polymerase
MMSPMYDEWTRLALSQELADAFGYGPWGAEDLAERAAGQLDRRPGWLDALAFEVAALARRGEPARSELVGAVERFLREHAAAPADAAAPQILRLIRPTAAAPLDHDWPIARIESVAALAEHLELSLGQLQWLADVRGLERTVARERLRNYRYRWVPRRSGLPRLIEAPKLRLKEIQRWVLREILDHVPPHDAAYGFRRGRSVVDHAAQHVATAAVLRLDLRDFFASVPAGRVFGIFVTIGYSPPIAHVLTGLTTNTAAQMAWNALAPVDDPALAGPRFTLGRRLATPHLPQGAPTSPALANLAAIGLDRRLAGLAAAHAVTYSRYADDLTLSGAGLTERSRYRALAEHAAAISRDEGFVLNPAKTTLRTAARRQVVTGIVVNAHPNLARDEYDRLRATLHRLSLDGPGAVHPPPPAGLELRAHLNGRVAWAESLNPGRGAKLRRLWDAIDWEGSSAG